MTSAETQMAVVPIVVDTTSWYEEHAQLSFDLQVAAVLAARGQIAEAEVGKAHEALLAHAAIINGGSAPVLLAKDGEHTIPFQRLAAARAKNKVLEAENARLRAAGVQPDALTQDEWVEEHEWLIFDLLDEAKKRSSHRGKVDGAMQHRYDTALRTVLAHAQGVRPGQLPAVEGKGRAGTIPYELYAASRAEVRALRETIAQTSGKAKRAGGAKP